MLEDVREITANSSLKNDTSIDHNINFLWPYFVGVFSILQISGFGI